jgi:hypothetical protein
MGELRITRVEFAEIFSLSLGLELVVFLAQVKLFDLLG